MRLLAEVKVRGNRVFKNMDEQISGQKQRHRPQNSVPRLVPLAAAFPPQNDHFRHDFDKNRRQHEASAERDEVAEKMAAALKSAGAGQKEPAHDVGQRHEDAEEEKFAEAHPKIRDRRPHLSLYIYILAAQYTGCGTGWLSEA